MWKISFFVLCVCLTVACQRDDIGYLLTSYASYSQDTLVVKSEEELDLEQRLNPDFQLYLDMGYSEAQIIAWGIEKYIWGEDYARYLKQAPWVSVYMEGVQGTSPIFMSIAEVKTASGDISAFMDQVKLYSNGRFEVPFKHTIPVGRYLITVAVHNEHGTQLVEDCFTIIIH